MAECDNCHGTAGVTKMASQSLSLQQESGETHVRLCVYCAGSVAGNAFFFPRNYEGADVMRALAGMMNILEKRIRR